MERIKNKLFDAEYDPYLGFNPIELDAQGWGSDSSTFVEVIEKYNPKVIVEVGSWKGCSAIHMANICKSLYGNNDFEIVCVDTFLGSVEHWDRSSVNINYLHGRPYIYEQFLSNIIHFNHTDVVTPLPIDSHNAYQVLAHYEVVADLVYIDAGHDYDAVKRDLSDYINLLREGGVLLVDDMHHEPIQRACEELLINTEIRDNKLIWIK